MCIASRSVLQDMIKGVLQVRGKDSQAVTQEDRDTDPRQSEEIKILGKADTL